LLAPVFMDAICKIKNYKILASIYMDTKLGKKI